MGMFSKCHTVTQIVSLSLKLFVNNRGCKSALCDSAQTQLLNSSALSLGFVSSPEVARALNHVLMAHHQFAYLPSHSVCSSIFSSSVSLNTWFGHPQPGSAAGPE